MLALVFSRLGLGVEWIYGALIADYILKVPLMVDRFRSTRWHVAVYR